MRFPAACLSLSQLPTSAGGPACPGSSSTLLGSVLLDLQELVPNLYESPRKCIVTVLRIGRIREYYGKPSLYIAQLVLLDNEPQSVSVGLVFWHKTRDDQHAPSGRQRMAKAEFLRGVRSVRKHNLTSRF